MNHESLANLIILDLLLLHEHLVDSTDGWDGCGQYFILGDLPPRIDITTQHADI